MGRGRKIIDENNNHLFTVFSPGAYLQPSAPRSQRTFGAGCLVSVADLSKNFVYQQIGLKSGENKVKNPSV